MAHSVAFDTLAFAKKLESHGVLTEQAEAHAEALAEVLDFNFVSKKKLETTNEALSSQIDKKFALVDNRFTQLDNKIDLLQSTLRQEINTLRQEMKQDSSDLRQEMKQDSSDLRQDMKQDSSDLRQEMIHIKVDVIKWVLGIAFAQTALIFSVLKFFH